MSTRQRGQWAEDEALRFLQARNLVLVERNFQCRVGELDLIMTDERTLVIIEVRYRRSSRYGTPLATITANKQQKIMRATRYYLLVRKQFKNALCRFDVVAINGPNYAPSFQWTRGAFTE